MTYLIKSPVDSKSKQEAKYNHDLSSDMFIFRKGKYVSKNELDKPIIFNLKLTTSEAIKFDQIINDSTCLLVNQKIIDILMKLAPEEVQFFDTEVRCKDGVLTNYKLVNFTEEVVAVDRENSIVETILDTKAIGGFKRLVFNRNCLGTHKLARLAEFHGHMLGNEEMKQAFESACITGLRFVTPENYYADIYPNYAQS